MPGWPMSAACASSAGSHVALRGMSRSSDSVVSISATKFNDGEGDNQRFFQDPFHWFFGPDRDGRSPQQRAKA